MTTATLNVYHRHTEPVSVSRHPELVSGPLSANTTAHTELVSVSRTYVTLKYNQDDTFY